MDGAPPLRGQLLLLSLLLHTTGGSLVQVDPEVSAYVGDDVTLPCRYSSPSGEHAPSIIQVQWFWKQNTVDEIQNENENLIIVFSSSFGMNVVNSSLRGRLEFSSISPAQDVQDASIRISQVRQADQGHYTCEFITFPAGAFRANTTLTVTEAATGHLSPCLTAAVVKGTILAVLLLVNVVFIIITRRRKPQSAPDCHT